MKRLVLFMVTALMVAVPVRKLCGQVSQASEAVAESLINVMLRESGKLQRMN